MEACVMVLWQALSAAWPWLLWLGMGLLVVWGISAAVAGPPRPTSPAEREALALRRRYARGLISKTEYRARRRALRGW